MHANMISTAIRLWRCVWQDNGNKYSALLPVYLLADIKPTVQKALLCNRWADASWPDMHKPGLCAWLSFNCKDDKANNSDIGKSNRHHDTMPSFLETVCLYRRPLPCALYYWHCKASRISYNVHRVFEYRIFEMIPAKCEAINRRHSFYDGAPPRVVITLWLWLWNIILSSSLTFHYRHKTVHMIQCIANIH